MRTGRAHIADRNALSAGRMRRGGAAVDRAIGAPRTDPRVR